MKRRNFVGGLVALACGAVAGCKCSTSLKVEKPDPFVKIHLIKKKTIYSNDFGFTQISDNHVLVYNKNDIPGDHRTFIPLDSKENQNDKQAFLNELNKYDIEWDMFELVADNGKSNIYACSVNTKNNNKAWGV